MLVILMVALTNFIVGSIMGPGQSEEKQAKGFLGYNCNLIFLYSFKIKFRSKLNYYLFLSGINS